MGDPVSLGFGAVSAAANAIKLLQTINDVRDATNLLALKNELLGLLVEAQLSQSTLVEEKRQLAERVRQLENWDAEKQRYKLSKVGYGTTAYTLKPEANDPELPHMLCTNCFKQGEPSVLQYDKKEIRGTYSCPRCKTKIHTSGNDLAALGIKQGDY